jgi:hypothetical protein
MSQYMNPFTQNVIDRSLADIGGAQQTAMGQLGAQAQAARAFGGSRQGIAQAETNKGFTKQIADTSANLNLQGYNQAQQAAFQDIAARNQMGLANQAALNQAGQFGQERQIKRQWLIKQPEIKLANLAQAQLIRRLCQIRQHLIKRDNSALARSTRLQWLIRVPTIRPDSLAQEQPIRRRWPISKPAWQPHSSASALQAKWADWQTPASTSVSNWAHSKDSRALCSRL